MAQHLGATAGVELRDAEALDIRLGGEAELGLHRQLHRQPMTVPTPLALDVAAAHGPVAGEDVLEDAREHMVDARRSVCRWRPLIEAPGRRALATAKRLAEDLPRPPALQHKLLELGEGGLRVDRSMGRRHGAPDSRNGGAQAFRPERAA